MRAAAKRKRAPARAPNITETQVHKQVADYFRKVGLGGCAVAFHIRNERPGDWQRINAKRMGAWSGLPDWGIVEGGRAGFIELKPAGWKTKKYSTGNYTAHEMRQIETHNLLKRAGAWVEICETLEEVVAALRYHGVPLRETDIVTEGLRAHLPAAMAAAESAP